jgi:hypothetical protein
MINQTKGANPKSEVCATVALPYLASRAVSTALIRDDLFRNFLTPPFFQ